MVLKKKRAFRIEDFHIYAPLRSITDEEEYVAMLFKHYEEEEEQNRLWEAECKKVRDFTLGFVVTLLMIGAFMLGAFTVIGVYQSSFSDSDIIGDIKKKIGFLILGAFFIWIVVVITRKVWNWLLRFLWRRYRHRFIRFRNLY